ncbi:hypothetical protein GGI12_000079 [Dipsacomyces acuminosporus]|nr:hypothetical protein GGI12_000079 [Dipsacomyces acuminosporus]
MALKAELEQWHQAVEYFDVQNYNAALDLIKPRGIADSAKIHFNIGLILGRKGDHSGAIDAYTTALSLDKYLVVAYFQRGVARMVLQQNKEALNDFNDALTYLRDNDCIDYSQIGLEYKVYTCEVLYNRALCYFCLGNEKGAHSDLEQAGTRASEERHSWIKKALSSSGMDCPLYCVPRGVIYRPSASKLKSSKKIDFLGSAKVIASADGKDNFTGFKGALVRKETMRATGASPKAPISHQNSMRVKKTTPPPGAANLLSRSNTMPAHRHNPLTLPNRGGSPGLAESSQPPKSAAAAVSPFQKDAREYPADGYHNDYQPKSAGPVPNSSLRYQSPNPKPEPEPHHQHQQQHQQQPEPQPESQEIANEPVSEQYSTPGSSRTPPLPTITAPPATAPIITPEPLRSIASAPPDQERHNALTPKSALKRSPGSATTATGRAGVDPLDIIRAGLARRTTLKNQQSQNSQRAKPAQRSVTLKLPTRSQEYGDDADDYEYSEADYGNGNGNDGSSSSNQPPHSALTGGLSRLHINGHSNHVARTPTMPYSAGPVLSNAIMHQAQSEVITPEIQKVSSTDEIVGNGSGYYDRDDQSQHSQMMMTPPLSHEEVSRGLAPLRVQNVQIQSSMVSGYGSGPMSSINGSPADAAPGASGVASPSSNVNGATSTQQIGGGGLRRALTKRGAMKVKLHYGADVFNLVLPSRVSYDTLCTRISEKLSNATGQQFADSVKIRYLDEDGEAVLMTDQDDFELAKAYAGGDMSSPETNIVDRLELWCS